MEKIYEKMKMLTTEGRELVIHLLNDEGISLKGLPIINMSKYYRDQFPLSFSQKRLWFINQMISNIPSYNCSIAVRLKGEVNLKLLNEAFNLLIKRHKVLMTNYLEIDGEPWQVLREGFEINISLHLLSHLEQLQQEKELKEGLIKESQYVFDLSNELLIRATLFQIQPEDHVLCIVMHHIICDGWSTEIMVREIANIYNALIIGDTVQLEELTIQYSDFAIWQNTMLNENSFNDEKVYWLEKLSNLLGAEIPTDLPRSRVLSNKGERYSFLLPRDITEKIKHYCRKNDVTLFIYLITVLEVLIHRYTNESDVIIGTPVAGRNKKEIENLIGFFVNTIVLREYIDGDMVFSDLLNNSKNTILEAFNNQDYPFDMLVDQMKVDRDFSRNALFQVMFVLQSKLDSEEEAKGLKCEEFYSINNGTSMFEIKFEVIETEKGLNISIDYNPTLFLSSTIQGMGKRYGEMIQNLLNQPESKLESIKLLTEDEEELLYQPKKEIAKYPYEKTIHEIFEEQAAKTPEAVAVVFKGREMTYGELNERANQLAYWLRESGVTHGKRVALILERSFNMIISILGVLKAGGAYVPIDSDYPMDRKSYTLKDSGAKILITDHENQEITLQGIRIINIEAMEVKKGYEKNFKNIVEGKSLAYIIYTSGTTGQPKGAMIEHRNVISLLFNEEFQFDFGRDTWTLFHSYCFDFSVWEIFGALLYGGKLVIVDKPTTKDPLAYLDLLKREKVTILNQTPSVFYNLIRLEMECLEIELSIRMIIFGGESLKPAKLKDWKNRYPNTRLINMYGITETTVFVTLKELTEIEIASNQSNIGVAIPNLKTYVMDQDLNLLPIGIPGELMVAGAGVGRGYLNKQDLTNAKFILNPYNPNEVLYRSGDLVKLLPNMDMEYLGRIDHQVKIRGFRIEIGDIESHLLSHPNVGDAVVIVKEDSNEDKKLIAYVILKEEEQDISNLLRSYLKDRLPEYMIPTFFIPIDEIPLTSNGKVDRRKLPNIEVQPINEVDFLPPKNEIEMEIKKIWIETLEIETVSTNEHFFNVGGNSLNSMLILSRIQKKFNVRITLQSFFENATIMGLGQLVRDNVDNEYMGLEKVEEKEYYSLTSTQKWLYLTQELQPSNIRYNIPILLEIEGNISVKHLTTALNTIIQRHESLRTIFILEDGEPVQKILDRVEIELRQIEENDPSKIKGAIMASLQPFKLNEAPLMRGLLIKRNYDYLFFFDLHHIIFDGVSVSIFINELNALYNQHQLQSPEFQYKDFSEWQRRFLESEEAQKQEKYWLNQLEGNIPRLNLPVTFSNREMNTPFDGKSIDLYLEEDIARGVKKLVEDNQVTLHMIFLTVFLIMLNRITDQKDMIIGIPVSGRRTEDFYNIIGVFINTLPLRIKIDEKLSFYEFLNQVKDYSINAYENQDYPLEDMMYKVSHAPNNSSIIKNLFDVMFEFRENEIQDHHFKMQDLSIKQYEIKEKTTQFLLDWLGLYNGREISFRILYRETAFEDETIQLMVNFYLEIIKVIITNPTIKIKDIAIENQKTENDSQEEDLSFDF